MLSGILKSNTCANTPWPFHNYRPHSFRIRSSINFYRELKRLLWRAAHLFFCFVLLILIFPAAGGGSYFFRVTSLGSQWLTQLALYIIVWLFNGLISYRNVVFVYEHAVDTCHLTVMWYAIFHTSIHKDNLQQITYFHTSMSTGYRFQKNLGVMIHYYFFFSEST